MDAVTEVLLDRSHQADRLTQMVVVSLLVHGLLLTAVTMSGRFWQESAPADEHVMTIMLAGGEGPIQGHNPESAVAIQKAVPDIAKPKNDAPPMLTKPEMVEPIKPPRETKAITKNEPKKETPQLHGRTPTQGTEVREGTARRDTGQTTAIPFGGIATGGNFGNAARTDVGDFCCPEYLTIMQQRIYANWRPNQGQPGMNTMKFVVLRDGRITNVSVEKSGGPFLDLASTRVLEQAQMPPLPAAYRGDRLTVYLDFRYK
jgi:outer membrane biosynthesis protein TonB